MPARSHVCILDARRALTGRTQGPPEPDSNETAGRDLDRLRVDVDEQVLAPEFPGGHTDRPGPAEEICHQVTWIG